MNRKWLRNRFIKRVFYVLYFIIAVFILLEITLRIYNPFDLRLKGDRILLPINKKIITKNNRNPRLDSVIINTRNSLGLRGPEPPAFIDSLLSVITVGGSTTECYFLNDDSTWAARLAKKMQTGYPGIWVNNAGLSGHSTFGHDILLNDHLKKLRPKIIMFLTGVNDFENDGPAFHDKLNTRGAYPDLLHYLYNHSEALNVAINIARGYRAQQFQNTTDELKAPKPGNELALDADAWAGRIKKQHHYLRQYRIRLNALADTCIANGIMPVFMTQPWLYGSGIDSITGVNLATCNVGNGMNGGLFWRLLQMYNDEVRSLCRQKNIPLIDLADNMPKNSLYYYDPTHYTNEGAERIAGIIADPLDSIIRTRLLPHK